MEATSIQKRSPAKAEVKKKSFPIVAIGSSAGGLEAMMELLKYLPADTGMAFIYVQHLSPDHKSMLTEILSKKTSIKVQEIDDMDKIKPNNVFVIPPNKGIKVTDGHIKLIPRAENSSSISIDILFSSLAHAHKERVIGVILSGSASDGTLGMKDIKHEGGLTFVQDNSAKFNSMPHSAIAAGVVDFILSPKEIALELARLSKHPLIKTIGIKNGEEDLIDNRSPVLKTILNQLHKTTGVDFSSYKMNTVKRRIIRRMLLYKITSLKEYVKLLSQKKEEIDILYQDLLINVTSFFRDTDTHKYLKESLFPKLLKTKKSGEQLRIWVAACATGEEAYSIAMVLLEIQESQPTNSSVHIFATDLSEQAIKKARIGIYTKQELETISPKRIQRFFSKANGGFRINKTVRDMCVFAPHNILQDPPFSRLDFISCCNLFIYLDIAAQKKAVNTFHYALNDGGYLMLGKSENITQSTSHFTDFSKKYKIFLRKKNLGTSTLPVLLPRYKQQTSFEKNLPLTNKNKTNQIIHFNNNILSNAIDALLVSEFMPSSVVINHQMEIVQFRGTTELFLTHPQGNATFNILKMARPGLAFELRNAISKVIKTNQRLRKSGIELKINAAVKIISLEIVPIIIESDEHLLLILFTEHEQTELYSKQANSGKNNSLAKDQRIKKLEQELEEAHLDALAFAQDQEAFTEELQSANEEVVSSNEELQTINEELGTSKEETESANEELIVTNQELQTRNDLLNKSYEYSNAIIATMHNPILVLDKSLRVHSASKMFYKKFNVTEEETEGVKLYDLGNRQWNIPRLRKLLENILLKNAPLFDFEITHTFPFIGKKIMLLNASRIVHETDNEELILLAFADVTEVRKLALEKEITEKKIVQEKLDTQIKLREITEESEKKQVFLLKLSDAIKELIDPVDIQLTACRILGEHLKMNRVLYGEVIDEEQIISINNYVNGVSPIISTLDAEQFGRNVIDAFKRNEKVIISDINTDPGYTQEEKQNFLSLDVVAIASMGLVKGGRWVATFGMHYNAPRKWTAMEIWLMEETAERTWASVERARSERKLRNSEEKYRTLFTSIDQGCAFCELVRNKEGKGIDVYILEVNSTCENQAGVIAEMVFGKTFLQVYPTLDNWWIETCAAVVDNQSPTVFEHYFENTNRWFAINAYPGLKDRFAILFSDITERKLFEKELVEAKLSAEVALQFKQQFLSNMSHEIRTPLNSILGFTNILLKAELLVEQKEFLQAIKTSGDSLYLLINDILDLAKVNAGKMIFVKQPFEISKSIKSIIYSFGLRAKEKNLQLIEEYDSNIPLVLLGDSVRLNQIILNLISNSIKFTETGKIELVVKLQSENEQNVTIEFALTDSGIGIAPNKINSIFNLFEQAVNGTTKSYGGTGLGLAIVKQLIETQGGSISVKSKLGQGSTFSFILPFEKTNIKLEQEIGIPKPDSEIKNLCILVAEDVELNQMLIKIVLNNWGFQYEIVNTGKLAIEKLQTNTYDIILMDLHMPEMNGFEATEYIRQTIKSQIPIIALTADVTTAGISKCMELGMDDYISKPIDVDLLYSKIVELVKKKQ